jgi:lysophospholipase L1-like esterase
MLKKYTASLLYIIFIFLFLELLTRFFFKEFNENSIYYDIDKYHRISKGKDTFFQYVDKTKFRVSKFKEKILFNEKNSYWFLGDSITNGYGVDFEDTYYQKFKEIIDDKLNVYASSEYNTNFKNTFANLNNSIYKFLKEDDVVIYQFNFNDIIEIAEKDTKFEDEDLTNSGLIKIINNTNIYRYKYLNHSSFFKLLQHYASIAARKTNGTCSERKIHALGPYTYAYFAKGYEEKSQNLWDIFINDVIQTNLELNSYNVNFLVLIPPISLEVTKHEKVNKLNYNLNCSTKNAREYLIYLLNKNNIKYIDTLPKFNNYVINVKQQNSNILFHPYDTNHPNEKGHELIAEAIYNYFQNN